MFILYFALKFTALPNLFVKFKILFKLVFTSLDWDNFLLFDSISLSFKFLIPILEFFAGDLDFIGDFDILLEFLFLSGLDLFNTFWTFFELLRAIIDLCLL